MHLGTSFDTRLDARAAYDYLADFATIAEWDPLVARAERLDPGPPRVGSRYVVVGRVLGREITLDYRIVELDAPRRIKLVGSAGHAFSGWDEMTITPAPTGGAAVRYEAEVRLSGRARLLWLLAPLAMILAGRNAMRGMQRRLDSMAPA